MRRVHYLTGTRADFGLMRSTLEKIRQSTDLGLGILVTGMHLDAHYGNTVREVEDSGLPLVARIPVSFAGHDGAAMAKAIATTLNGVVDAWRTERPDALLLLGDRGEMLAGALAALHLNVPIVHLHGGELSGTVDEPIRHAISKLAHYHFVATEKSRERLVRMGERPETVFVTGAPGLDGIDPGPTSRVDLAKEAGFDPQRPIALVVFHPVVQDALAAGAQAQTLLAALEDVPSLQALLLMPNADAGSEAIRAVFARAGARFQGRVHLGREVFHRWMAIADVLVGNSSSGIIEAASFGLPVVNVGDRQKDRERNVNVRDVPVEKDDIATAVCAALSGPRPPAQNLYGDGRTGERVVDLLRRISLGPENLRKQNAY